MNKQYLGAKMNKHQEAYGRIINSSNLNIQIKNGLPMNQDTEDVLLVRELVNKATPQKPINKHVLKQFGICPSCNADVSIRYHVVACGKCGKYLDWSKDE